MVESSSRCSFCGTEDFSTPCRNNYTGHVIHYTGSPPLPTFIKHDKEKCRPDLIPAEFYEELGWVAAHGGKKYGDDNWKNCNEPRRYLAAALRHLLSLLRGEELDPESGKSHAAHVGCCMAFYFWLKRNK